MRVKTNVVNIKDLKSPIPKGYSEYFDADGNADMHKAFKEVGEQYSWLYDNSNIDLISWEIENDVFDWDKESYYIAKYYPQYVDHEKYSWEKGSCFVAMFCPERLNPDKYNWERDSCFVAMFCPERIDPTRYNWEKYSDQVASFCPEKLELRPQ